MDPFSVGQMIQPWLSPSLAVSPLKGSHAAEGRKILADAFSVFLPLCLDETPGPLGILDWQKPHSYPKVARRPRSER